MTRYPAVAGQFYEDEPDKLMHQIKECFHHSLGPGALPVKKREGFLKAIIAPHAGYIFSGPCAAWAYKEIAESQPANLYILIGPNHFGAGSSVSIEDWKTPLGILKSDKDFIRELAANTELTIDDSFHSHEHAIEVQLPFLYFANKEHIKDVKIACITLSHDINISKLSNDLSSLIEKQNKKITFIISSDFTHYGRNYRYLPFTLDVEKRLRELDKKAFELIIEKNAEEFMEHIQKTGATVCGFMPIYLLLKLLKDEKGALLRYYTSAEISGDKKNSVSYACIIFK